MSPAPPAPASGATSPAAWPRPGEDATHRQGRMRLPRRGLPVDRLDRDARSTRSSPTRGALTRTPGERRGWTIDRRIGTRLRRRTASLRSVFEGFDRLASTHAAEGDAAED